MVELWVTGLGITTATQLTREAEHAIRSSREVLYLDAGVATQSLLESLCPKVTSLFEESYSEDRPRLDAYEHIAARVMDAALDHPPVTFAIHGHPLIATNPPFLVLDLAKALDVKTAVLPGVSAIDSILADLRVDPVVSGVQMYEATDLLLRRRPLQADVPLIIWQIGPLETALHSNRVSSPKRFERFIAYLCQFYPARHEVTAVYCSPHPLMPADILKFAIEDMGAHAHRIHAGFSLYVPPAKSRPIQDYDLLGKLYSAEHLDSITR
jgi:precorrin-2 methylase